ncbi:MAG: Hsp20/alpha crystallin family protein [Deltaproteobacteria bacterium]|nr:Hsp20/alpha crystallin family protein [Deltaproteobacteria bacterium]
MNITPYRDYGTFANIDRLFGRLLNDMSWRSSDETETALAQWRPAVDIREDSDKYVVVADLPGISPKEVEITFENGLLSISGERNSEQRTEADGYSRIERVSGKFSRQFRLPDSVDQDAISASGKNGVIEISIPKKDKAKPKRIEIS